MDDEHQSLVDEIYLSIEKNNTNKNHKIKDKYLQNNKILFNYCKLFRSYLKTIIKNNDNKYNYVELVEFVSPLMGLVDKQLEYKRHKYLGMPETFGSIARMLVMYDPDVSMWFLVNSRNPINPILEEQILEFSSNDKKHALIFNYSYYGWNTNIRHPEDRKIVGDDELLKIAREFKAGEMKHPKDMNLWKSIKPTIDILYKHKQNYENIYPFSPYNKWPRLLAGLIGGKNKKSINYQKNSFEAVIKTLIENGSEFLYGIDEYILSMVCMHDIISKLHYFRSNRSNFGDLKNIMIRGGSGKSFIKDTLMPRIDNIIANQLYKNNDIIQTCAKFSKEVVRQLSRENMFPYYISELVSLDAIEYEKNHSSIMDLITSVNEKRMLLCSDDILNKDEIISKYTLNNKNKTGNIISTKHDYTQAQKAIASKLFDNMFEFITIPFNKIINDEEAKKIEEKIIKYYKENIISVKHSDIYENMENMYKSIPDKQLVLLE